MAWAFMDTRGGSSKCKITIKEVVVCLQEYYVVYMAPKKLRKNYNAATVNKEHQEIFQEILATIQD